MQRHEIASKLERLADMRRRTAGLALAEARVAENRAAAELADLDEELRLTDEALLACESGLSGAMVAVVGGWRGEVVRARVTKAVELDARREVCRGGEERLAEERRAHRGADERKRRAVQAYRLDIDQRLQRELDDIVATLGGAADGARGAATGEGTS